MKSYKVLHFQVSLNLFVILKQTSREFSMWSSRVHQKSNAKKVSHPSIISTLGNLTLDFLRDPDFSLAFKPPCKIQPPWFLCQIDLCEYIYRTRIDWRMLTTIKCARDWQWLYFIFCKWTPITILFLRLTVTFPFYSYSYGCVLVWVGVCVGADQMGDGDAVSRMLGCFKSR